MRRHRSRLAAPPELRPAAVNMFANTKAVGLAPSGDVDTRTTASAGYQSVVFGASTSSPHCGSPSAAWEGAAGRVCWAVHVTLSRRTDVRRSLSNCGTEPVPGREGPRANENASPMACESEINMFTAAAANTATLRRFSRVPPRQSDATRPISPLSLRVPHFHPFRSSRLLDAHPSSPISFARRRFIEDSLIDAFPTTDHSVANRTKGSQLSRGISSVGRALAWHARGQEFESPILHFP